MGLTIRRQNWSQLQVTDPSEVPPQYYHRDLFIANFPLVDVVDVPEGYPFPVPDKFEGAVLDEETTRGARVKWIGRFLAAHDRYKAPENEKQAFPQQFAFLEPLKKLTRPSRADIDMHNRLCGKRKWRYEDVKKVGRPKAVKPHAEELEGMYIQVVSEPDSSALVPGPEEGELREDATGFADGVIHVFSDGVINPDRVAGVLERKFVEDKLKWNARFEGGFYAAKHAIENIRKLHGNAVYVIVMTSCTWSYAILVPEGYVEINSGSIAPSSMEAFERHQQVTKLWSSDAQTLEKKLEEGTRFYQQCFADNPGAVYKDGPMLVGKLYLSSSWYNLPRAVAGGGRDDDARRLFDGLLRLVSGDSVMDLSSKDFEERICLRKTMKSEQLEAWFS